MNTPTTEAILSNEDRKLKFDTNSNGHDTQQDQQEKMKRRREIKQKSITLTHRETDTLCTTHSSHHILHTERGIHSQYSRIKCSTVWLQQRQQHQMD